MPQRAMSGVNNQTAKEGKVMTYNICPCKPQCGLREYSSATCHPITQTDWIRRAHDQVFHLACFACDSCARQLSTGEEFGLVCDKVNL